MFKVKLDTRITQYFPFVENAFLSMLAYRLRYFTGIITYTLFISVNYFVWKAVYHDDFTKVINGYTLSEMITYLVVSWIARSLYFSTIDEDIDSQVRSGQIGSYLLKPVNYHLMMLVQALGESLFRLAFFTLPIAIVALTLFPVQPPASFLCAVGFLCATFVSFFVLAEINFLVGLLSFVTSSSQGIIRAKYYFIQLLSGLLLPIAFFPDWLRPIIEALPFKLITAIPLQIYLGKYNYQTGILLTAELLVWILILAGISTYFWEKAFKRLTVQGG